MANEMYNTDVLIVGAGPTGLILAAALQSLGVSIKIIELKPKLSDTTKATNLMQGTQEQLAIYNLIQPMFDISGKMSRMVMEGYGTNLGARTMHLTESPFNDVLLLGQDNIEKSLANSLSNLGVQIHFDTKLTSLIQNENGVVTTLQSVTNITTENYKYVIGCDGPWGITRTFTKCDFKPVKTDRTIRQVDAKLKWKRLNSMKQMWLFYFADGFAVVVPLLDGYYRILTIEPSENIPNRNPTLEEMKSKLIEVTKDNSIEMLEPKWFSYANLTMGIAPQIIDNKVILAGDAGNPILPNGGQGLNTGIQDSLNLAWKLADVIKNNAKTELLTTYQTERLALRIALEKIQFNSLKYTTKAPKFMQWVVGKLGNWMLDKGGEKGMAKTFSQLNINYKKSPLTVDKIKKGSVKAGNRILDGDIIQASTLQEVSLFQQLSKPVWKLLVFDNKKQLNHLQQIDKIKGGLLPLIITASTITTYETAYLYYDIDELVHKIYGIHQPTILLVRPDNYVALSAKADNLKAVENYFANWYN
ncbi:FAD-dependent monooxygenase [Parasediminibacterium paludis]|uniref:FAD-dependent monooxygenase n=1 Tax=Parasediminibacterium paludis TaxID=908966 RepID=A0ABV8PTQ1_9BACT